MLIVKDEASGARRWNTWSQSILRVGRWGDGWKYWWKGSYLWHPMKSGDHLVKLL